MLLCLTLFAGCSNADRLQPPPVLLETAKPLPRPPVATNRALVSRLIASEKAYDELASRFNTLIAWIAETAP